MHLCTVLLVLVVCGVSGVSAQEPQQNTTEEVTAYIRVNHVKLETFFAGGLKGFQVLEVNVDASTTMENEVASTFVVEEYKESEEEKIQVLVKEALVKWLGQQKLVFDADMLRVLVASVTFETSSVSLRIILAFDDDTNAIKIGITVGVLHVAGLLVIIIAAAYYNRKKMKKQQALELDEEGDLQKLDDEDRVDLSPSNNSSLSGEFSD